MIQGDSERRAAIQRNRNLLGAEAWGPEPHDPPADCVEISPRNPENFRRFADQPPGRICGKGARFREISRDLAELSEIATYLGRIGRISRPVILWLIV